MKRLTSRTVLCAAAWLWGCSGEADSGALVGSAGPSTAPGAEPADQASSSSSDPVAGNEPVPSADPGSAQPIGDPTSSDVINPEGLVEHAPWTNVAGSRTRRLALGWSHACATNQQGLVACGGWDWSKPALTSDCDLGNLIEGTFTPPATQLAYVDGEAYATCGIEQETQVLKCWGEHYVSDALTELPGAVQVTVSVSQACALTVADQVVCNGPRVIPELSGLSAVEIAMGHEHICALLPEGEIVCHRYGIPERDWGQADVPAGQYKFLAAGRSTTCAITAADSELRCWGLNDKGQASPPPGKYAWVDVGPDHGCGVLDTREIVCWGANDNGESTPPAGSFDAVAVGSDFSCALTSFNTVACWGTPYCANTALPSEL